MNGWVDPLEPYRKRRRLLRAQYNALGKLNLAGIGRIAASKYQRETAFARQHPFVDILLSDITESGEALDISELVREPPPPHSIGFQRVKSVSPPGRDVSNATDTASSIIYGKAVVQHAAPAMKMATRHSSK